MTSITRLKAELREDIVALILDVYLSSDTPTKLELVSLLTRRMAKGMTLSQLQYWQDQLEQKLER